ncbi:hypothetical protein [Sphingomonas sp. Leaf23]|uniref:hypothetical protein n=1 Tax=Sphingomonas sp. Leaf23 TaxID=1735689 RepID=UPI0012E139EA|nr:hypothetical protein [Sphingomonas sp. Leaf23]
MIHPLLFSMSVSDWSTDPRFKNGIGVAVRLNVRMPDCAGIRNKVHPRHVVSGFFPDRPCRRARYGSAG